jgi:hypothetical protein
MQQPLRGGDLQIHRLCLVLHPPLVDRRGRALGEPGKYSPDTPALTVLEDLGVEASSPGAALTRVPAPRTTKSCNKLLTLSPSRGPTSTTSAPVATCSAPPTPDTSIVDATT